MYNKNPLLILLRPLSLLFYWLSKRRKERLSAQAWLPPVPTIIVGNISIGGTGKTPLVIYLAKFLRNQGFQPLIISRGYKGQYQGIKIVSETDNPNEVGDEALLIKRQTGVPLFISADRVAAAKLALGKNPPIANTSHTDPRILISDDGLQHYKLGRHIEIAVVDASRKFGNRQLLPEGPLREKLSRLNSVDFIVVNEGKESILQELPASIAKDKLCSMEFVSDKFYPVYTQKTEGGLSIDAFKARFGTTIKAIAAIGNPPRFFNHLENLGFQVDAYDFPDHHFFSQSELIEIALNKNPDYPLVMTAKDAVKCEDFALEKLWYLGIHAKLEEDFNQLLIEKLTRIKHDH